MMELLTNTVPLGTTVGSNFKREGRFMAMSSVGSRTMGQMMGSEEMTTQQLAVPPRISGP